MPGCAVSLREVIFYFLQCCVKHERDADGNEVGALPVVWRKSRCETEMGCKTRRYSGFAPFLALEKKKAKGTKRADEDEEEDKTDPLEGRWEARFRALLEKGVPACYLGRSLFSVSKKSLRHLARTGLQGLDIDQVNAHFQAQLQRHPRARSLGEYIRNRETMLQQIIRLLEQGERQKPEGRASALLPSEARDAAKDLFIILGYGGCERKWCEDHGVGVERLPAFAREFSREQQDLRKQDVADNRDLYAKARALGHPLPDVKVQATLNLRAERETLDEIEEAVEGCCALASYEHDGIYVWRPPWEEREPHHNARTWAAALKLRLANVKVQEKPVPDFAAVLNGFRTTYGGDWDTVTENWKEQLELVQSARPGIAQCKQDRLYARIVALEAEPCLGFPWSVRDLFKHAGGGIYAFFDIERRIWRPASEHWGGRDKLLHVISTVLRRKLGSQCLSGADDAAGLDDMDDGLWVTGDARSVTQLLDHAPAIERIEKMLRALLKDPDFELDGEETRRYLRFNNGVYDFEHMTFVASSPEIRVTNCTEWDYDEDCGIPDAAKHTLEEALLAVQSDELRGEGISDETQGLLNGLCEPLPVLGFVLSLVGSWERALYLLKHVVRAMCALKYQDTLTTRGPGGNGKDTFANLVCKLLGTYFVDLNNKALTQPRDLDTPSQTFLGLRAKRFVCIREVAKNVVIKGDIFRHITDAKSKQKARNLHSQDQVFHPHYLLFACSNVPFEFDDKGRGTERRLRVCDMPCNFVPRPKAANDRLIKPDMEDQFPAWTPSFFYLLCRIRSVLMSAPAQEVSPVPDEVREAVAEELAEPWQAKLAEFVEKAIEPENEVKLASSCADVKDAFYAQCQCTLEKREVGLKLAARGFKEEKKNDKDNGKRSSKNVYTYTFPGGESGFVRLVATADKSRATL